MLSCSPAWHPCSGALWEREASLGISSPLQQRAALPHGQSLAARGVTLGLGHVPGPWGGVSRLLSPCPQESQEQGLRQRLQDEQFAMLRGAAAEAEGILQDAVSKLDDPLHLRCTSSPGARSGHLPTACAHCCPLP